MKAVAFTEFGGPDVLRVVDMPTPEPGPEQVRVRVVAATVNPTDILFRSGGRQFDPTQEPPPWVPGQEVAGYIDALGGGVTEWHAGDRVAAVTRPAPGVRGAQAEFATVWADSIASVPSDISLVAAATLPMNGLTALQSLELLRVAAGDTIAVSGAAGAVGGYVIQLARERGVRVLAIAAPADEALVRDLGADEFISRNSAVVRCAREVISDGADGVVDAALIGAPLGGVLRDGGRWAGLRGVEGAPKERGIVAMAVSVARSLHDGAKLQDLMRLVQAGRLTLRVAQEFTPEQAAEAHRTLERGGVRGRLVLVFT
jgi:NADPH:quinone reductase-like Zn-dependent oxidoreductase